MAKRKPKTVKVPESDNVFQFKITLKYIAPPIWRRFVVPDSYTLGDLHGIIQVVMGWENDHLHAFRIGGTNYLGQEPFSMNNTRITMEDADDVLLKDVFLRPKQRFSYEYDFGDSWQHEIVVEKVLPFDPQAKYPVCLDGARACPPEDCGSYPGYDDILAALKAKKKTEEQEERLEWVGDGYDPERFDLKAVNKQLAGTR